MGRLFEPLSFSRGPVITNRFMLAPMTNLQSHAHGVLSDEEFNWLTRLAAETRRQGSVAVAQPRHAGLRSSAENFPQSPSVGNHDWTTAG